MRPTWVAGQIEGCWNSGPGLAPDGEPWPDRAPGRQAADFAVLCRKRSQFAALRQALEARGIPVEVVGLGGLLAVPEVPIGGDAAGDARCGGVRRAGPAAHLAALADRAT